MAKTVIGLFDDVTEAQHTFQNLIDHGFPPDDLSIIVHQERAAAPEPASRWATRTLSVAGLGPVQATGPLAAALSSTSGGPTHTSLLDVLQDRGVPGDEAQRFLEEVRLGGTLLAVDSQDADADRAVDLMRRAMPPAQSARTVAGTEANSSQRGDDMETIKRSIDVNVPRQMAYQQWTRFEEFPQFMEGVEEVRRLDAKRLHWVANVGGSRKEWDSHITEDIPDERIAWRSEAGEFTAGVVMFQPLAANRTRVTVSLDYEPKGIKEKLGDWLGLVSGQVEGDLERFKSFVEARVREPAGRRTAGATQEHVGGRTLQPAASPSEGRLRFEDYDPDFQSHYHTAYARAGKAYDYWSPAYRYGYALATDPGYHGRDWATIEPEARREWEARHQGRWEEFKDAVYYAWEHVGGRRGRSEENVRIPVVEEQLQVGTRRVEQGGARIYSRMTETPVEREVSVRTEHVRVDRRPVDRPATDSDLAAAKEGMIEMTETTEEPIVRKQARVVEEVEIRKDVEEHTETVRDTVRRTEIEVESLGTEHATGVRDFTAYERDFRTHATGTFASRGQNYEYWAPGYHYGYELARNPRYSTRNWSEIETEARRDWEARRAGTWEEFKEAIHHAWDKVRGRR